MWYSMLFTPNAIDRILEAVQFFTIFERAEYGVVFILFYMVGHLVVFQDIYFEIFALECSHFMFIFW